MLEARFSGRTTLIMALLLLSTAFHNSAVAHPPPASCGDADASGQINIGDAVWLVNYLFSGGGAPLDESLGDINGDGKTNISDAAKLVYYIFSGVKSTVPPCRVTIQITDFGASTPTVSPDGEWIAFLSDGVAKMRIDGSDYQQLTSYGLEPDWSWIHDLILVRAGGLITVDPATGVTTPITLADGFDDGAEWSPDGSEIVAQENDGIVVFSYPDGDAEHLSCADPDGTECEGESPTFSPDGEWIAFEDGLELLKLSRSGGDASVLIQGAGDVAYPSWSPDGKWIAVTISGNIWIVDSRGMSFGLVQLTDTSDGDYDPTWAPDSRTIYFESNRSGQYEIWKINID